MNKPFDSGTSLNQLEKGSNVTYPTDYPFSQLIDRPRRLPCLGLSLRHFLQGLHQLLALRPVLGMFFYEMSIGG